MFFGTLKTPGGQERISYLVVFKHDISLSDGFALSHDGNISEGDRQFSSDFSVVVNERTVHAEHDVKIGEDKTVMEELEVNGEKVDLEAGRILLFDLTTDSPTHEQLDVDVPSNIPQRESSEDVERIAGEMLEVLKQEAPEFFE